MKDLNKFLAVRLTDLGKNKTVLQVRNFHRKEWIYHLKTIIWKYVTKTEGKNRDRLKIYMEWRGVAWVENCRFSSLLWTGKKSFLPTTLPFLPTSSSENSELGDCRLNKRVTSGLRTWRLVKKRRINGWTFRVFANTSLGSIYTPSLPLHSQP